ncbi:CoxG family protein [Marinibaculum pumilum]|uniref:CoxG family protein n=1 Tax=Marinibaculum pumilum TaxID=1766165 RepID=A0ABV7KVA4_9PROT
MDMSGEQLIAAPREKVWEALNDPDILGQCIPGCDSISKTSETGFEATVTAKIGPVKAKFKGAVELQDIDAPNSYKIVGEGKGGAAGFGKGSAKVSLSDAEGGTLMAYEVNAQVGGKLAQIGSRLVNSAAKKMADDFFDRFKAVVEAGSAAPAASDSSGSGGGSPAGGDDDSTDPAPAPAGSAAAEPSRQAVGDGGPAAAATAAAIAPEAGATHAAAAPSEPADQGHAHPPPPTSGGAAASGRGLSIWVWGAVLVIVVVAIAYIVTSSH